MQVFTCTIQEPRLYREGRIARQLRLPFLTSARGIQGAPEAKTAVPAAVSFFTPPKRGTPHERKVSMNEISQLLQNKFGLSPDQAQEAERAILDLIRSRVPAQFQGVVDSLLGSATPAGQAPAEGSSGELSSTLLNAAEGLMHRG